MSYSTNGLLQQISFGQLNLTRHVASRSRVLDTKARSWGQPRKTHLLTWHNKFKVICPETARQNNKIQVVLTRRGFQTFKSGTLECSHPFKTSGIIFNGINHARENWCCSKYSCYLSDTKNFHNNLLSKSRISLSVISSKKGWKWFGILG